MLNKFYKTIHNKYSKFFNFIFFLRYLFIIFFISVAIFLIIPIFFNYEKKAEIIKFHLLENYNFKLNDYKKIKYNIFPIPNLEILNSQINFKPIEENLSIKKIKIYPGFLNIYNYKNFNSKKIILIDSHIKFQFSNFYLFMKQLFTKKNKLYFDNLKVEIIDGKIPVFTIDNIKFANYGYKENFITGEIFDKNFQGKINYNLNDINFKLIKSGIIIEINFDENQNEKIKNGTFKTKILNTNFKSNFEYDGKIIKIYNSYFRSKNISLKNKSEIILNPFFEINNEFIIEEFNARLLKKINLNKFLKFKDFFREISSKSEIIYKPKKFDSKFFDDLNLNINLAYGRVNYSKILLISGDIVQCDGSINFLEEYPLLFFNCNLKSKNKKEFLKKFSVRTKNNNEEFILKMKGNFNILNNKINFQNISVNNNYDASKEDLRYFKETFETIFLDRNFIEIFDLKKIKELIIEIL